MIEWHIFLIARLNALLGVVVLLLTILFLYFIFDKKYLEDWLDVKEYAVAEKILIEDELTNKDAVITIIDKVGIICVLLVYFIFLLLYLFLFDNYHK